ncbi:hypothetical protein JKP88DRAFT_249022 [Tribonema minus]|uniref:Uncharacterized protein n=1 Tax=Tribonema minus TaxID=303371 RepID=A0A835YP46_9STRA|nr:hypothetical protein JKP88DRAFT_249022 [Tribonema minus]
MHLGKQSYLSIIEMASASRCQYVPMMIRKGIMLEMNYRVRYSSPSPHVTTQGMQQNNEQPEIPPDQAQMPGKWCTDMKATHQDAQSLRLRFAQPLPGLASGQATRGASVQHQIFSLHHGGHSDSVPQAQGPVGTPGATCICLRVMHEAPSTISINCTPVQAVCAGPVKARMHRQGVTHVCSKFLCGMVNIVDDHMCGGRPDQMYTP